MKSEMFFILAGICTFAHLVRTAYEIMKHRRILVPDKFSFVIVFINMILLWGSWFILCFLDPFPMKLPLVVNYLGLVIVLTGILIFLVALSTIKSLETYSGGLISHGIYSRIRHPMYLAFIFWLVGLPVFCEGFFSLELALVYIVNVLFWRYLEELELVNRFKGYEEYRQHTIF
jgi:protein-S-isoprenylcysteine O-methyltransferase Ste14